MNTKFAQLDAATATTWRQLTIQAWPLRVVTPEEYERMTEHLRIYDDPPAPSNKENKCPPQIDALPNPRPE
jgi:hypothetical protein